MPLTDHDASGQNQPSSPGNGISDTDIDELLRLFRDDDDDDDDERGGDDIDELLRLFRDDDEREGDGDGATPAAVRAPGKDPAAAEETTGEPGNDVAGPAQPATDAGDAAPGIRHGAPAPAPYIPDHAQDRALVHVGNLYDEHINAAADSSHSASQLSARVLESAAHMTRARNILIECVQPHTLRTGTPSAIRNILLDIALENCRPAVRVAVVTAEIVSTLPIAATETASAVNRSGARSAGHAHSAMIHAINLLMHVAGRFNYVQSASREMRDAALSRAVSERTSHWAYNMSLVHRLAAAAWGPTDSLMGALAAPDHPDGNVIAGMYSDAMAILTDVLNAERPRIERRDRASAAEGRDGTAGAPQLDTATAAAAAAEGTAAEGAADSGGSTGIDPTLDERGHAADSGLARDPLDDLLFDNQPPHSGDWEHDAMDDNAGLLDDILSGDFGPAGEDLFADTRDPALFDGDTPLDGQHRHLFDDIWDDADGDKDKPSYYTEHSGAHAERPTPVPLAPPTAEPRRLYALVSRTTEDIIVASLMSFVQSRPGSVRQTERHLGATAHFARARHILLDIMTAAHGRVVSTPADRSAVISEALLSLRPTVHVAFAAVELVLICDLLEVSIVSNSLRRLWDGVHLDSRVAGDLYALLRAGAATLAAVGAMLSRSDPTMDLPGVSTEQRRRLKAELSEVCTSVEHVLSSARRIHERGDPTLFWKSVVLQSNALEDQPDVLGRMSSAAWLVARTFTEAGAARLGEPGDMFDPAGTLW